MYRTRIVLLGVAVAALAGCDPQPGSAPSATKAAPAATTATSAAPANDAATTKACADIKQDLKDNATKIAKAQKIGPPAGHIAVSAQWFAGSAAVIAHSIGANDTVGAAADKVQKIMADLAEETNKSGNAKPSTAKLDAAVKELTAACSAA
ncbi:hypothetical protein ODJ79_29240 [Actinoplanes sp. KI2]|uniref:hypothetical protein n=1 Tax=Actinoplanes sp. KI2 TaxID=2983315 RepID=UPI0021D5BE2F|nr:hypothetical protein [Actinoplanes sp. KI2]MCU7727821.1 hypothetical protein [Actinoplanes sp. KI2]